MMGLLVLYNHPNKAPKPKNEKKKGEKKLGIREFQPRGPKGIEEDLEEEGEEEELIGSSSKGKSDKELPNDQTIESLLKKKKKVKISVVHRVSISTKTRAAKHITRHGKTK